MNVRNEMQPQTGEPGRSGRGPAWARALLAELPHKPGDVRAIPSAHGMELQEVETDGFERALIRASDLQLGAIAVRESIRGLGRKNFTIAQEIGRIVLPGHDRASLACTAADVANWADHSDAKAFKREADEFTAALPMPAEVVKRIIKGVRPSLGIIEKIARVTGVSFSTAAWRYCDLVAEKCAVVWSTEGKIQRAKRSADFPFLVR